MQCMQFFSWRAQIGPTEILTYHDLDSLQIKVNDEGAIAKLGYNAPILSETLLRKE